MPSLAEPLGVTRACLRVGCGAEFELGPFRHHQLFCSDRCRYAHRDATNPNVIRSNRERSRRWAMANRNVTTPQPWLWGAPPFGDYLPSVGLSLSADPYPRWPIELRNTRALHGMLTNLGIPHTKPVPSFALVPTSTRFGWGVIVSSQRLGESLANSSHTVRLYDRETTLRIGPVVRLKAPRVAKRGRRRLRIEAITPVSVRNSSSHWTHVIPTSSNLASTMLHHLPMRLGVEVTMESLRLELVSRETQVETVPLGGKYGNVRGWSGSCIVETNAVGEWLLRCSVSLGLGGRTAFGFGRVRVTGP